MRKSILIGLTVLLSACAGSPVRTEGEADRNREKLLHLSLSQTKDQVLAIMGRPYKTEMYVVDGKQTEFWLYLTEAGVGDDTHFTPLAFENGALKGWGRNFYDTTMRVRKEITIKKE